MDGQGKFKWNSGASYVGQWRKDKKDGEGVYTYYNGDQYKGNSIYTYIDCTVYIQFIQYIYTLNVKFIVNMVYNQSIDQVYSI